MCSAGAWGWNSELGISAFRGGENIAVSSIGALCPKVDEAGACCETAPKLKPPNAPFVCAVCPNEKAGGADCAVSVLLLFEPKPKVAPLVCVFDGCPNEKVGAAGCADCAAATLSFELKPNVVPLVCEGCPNEKLDGAEFEVL